MYTFSTLVTGPGILQVSTNEILEQMPVQPPLQVPYLPASPLPIPHSPSTLENQISQTMVPGTLLVNCVPPHIREQLREKEELGNPPCMPRVLILTVTGKQHQKANTRDLFCVEEEGRTFPSVFTLRRLHEPTGAGEGESPSSRAKGPPPHLRG